MFKKAGVFQEKIAETPVDFIRRSTSHCHDYFFANLEAKTLDGWVTLAVPAKSAMITDPLTGKKGAAALRYNDKGEAQIYLQIEPGQSLLESVFTEPGEAEEPLLYLQPDGNGFPVKGAWQIDFIKGDPVLPGPIKMTKLVSWTGPGDAEAKRFAGTASYKIELDLPERNVDEWVLDLGDVRDSARLRVNGKEVTTAWSLPFKTRTGAFLKPGKNQLEIEVPNTAANRIRDMDRRGVNWKIMREINFVNIRYQPFDASNWEIEPAGLLGPVRLIPMKSLKM